MTEVEFGQWWKLLCERFNRAPSAPLARMYATHVKAQGLSADEWGRAVQHAVIHERFMPAPQELVDYARLDGNNPTQAAELEWEAIMDRYHRNEPAFIPTSMAGQCVLRASNRQSLSTLTSTQMPFVKRDFIAQYVAALARDVKPTPSLLDAPQQAARPTRLELAHD